MVACGTSTAWREYGCRCEQCRAWHAADMARWREKMKQREKAKSAEAAACRIARIAAVAAQVSSAVRSAPLPARKPAVGGSVSFEDAWRRRG